MIIIKNTKKDLAQPPSAGDLPSPRVIEVIRAKEIHLPQWRILPRAQTPRSLRAVAAQLLLRAVASSRETVKAHILGT